MWWIDKFGSISGPYSDEQIQRGLERRVFSKLNKISADRRNWRRIEQTRFWDPSIPLEEENTHPVVQSSSPVRNERCAVPVPPPVRSRRARPMRLGLYVGVGIAAAALLCIVGFGVLILVVKSIGAGTDAQRETIGERIKERTVADVRKEIVQVVSNELAKPDSKLKKYIEEAHLTVTVDSTRIVRCDITTLDGSEKAGNDNSNIDKISLLIRFDWEGILESGYTDFRLVYDIQNERMLKSGIEYTTALINTKDPDFWWNVGCIIGAALF